MPSRKGSQNKKTIEVQEILARMNCEPAEALAHIVQNTLPCGVCRGTGKTKVSLGQGGHAKTCSQFVSTKKQGGWCLECGNATERVCESCYGSLLETCAPDLRFRAAAELMQYIRAKRRAVEVTGHEGRPIEIELSAVAESLSITELEMLQQISVRIAEQVGQIEAGEAEDGE